MYSVSPAAKLDLIEIWNYTVEQWSISQANSYLLQLEKEFESIVDRPKLGRDYNTLKLGYYGWKYKSHIIFYTIIDDKNIKIIRVLHQRMDIINKF